MISSSRLLHVEPIYHLLSVIACVLSLDKCGLGMRYACTESRVECE